MDAGVTALSLLSRAEPSGSWWQHSQGHPCVVPIAEKDAVERRVNE